MRGQAQSAEPSSDSATVEYRNGTGEHSQLEDKSVDGVIAAQAFHWFEPEEALIEFHRILKPHACTILMWNERDESDPFTTEYGDIIRAQKKARKQWSRREAAAQANHFQQQAFHRRRPFQIRKRTSGQRRRLDHASLFRVVRTYRR